MINETACIKEGNLYVPFLHKNDMETNLDYLCTF